jgi:hypothetical protein
MNPTKTRLFAMLIATLWCATFAQGAEQTSLSLQTTRIPSVPGQGMELTIYFYDDLGQLVGNLPNVPAVGVTGGSGPYLSIHWEGDELPSGIHSFAIDGTGGRYWTDYQVILAGNPYSVDLEAFNNTALPAPYLFDKSLLVEGSVEMLWRVFKMGNRPGGLPAFSFTLSADEDHVLQSLSSMPHAQWWWESSLGRLMTLSREFGSYGDPMLVVGQGRVLTTNYAGTKIAVGSGVLAPGSFASAFGSGSTAQGYNQFVVGQYNTGLGTGGVNTNPGDPLFIVGNGSSATARSNAFLIERDGDAYVAGKLTAGLGSSAANGAILSIGNSSAATGLDSVALGRYAYAAGIASNALGTGSTAYGAGAVALGVSSVAEGSNSLAFGSEATAFGASSLAFGDGAVAEGTGSLSIGFYNSAGADFSVAAGALNQANGNGSVAVGESLYAEAKNQVVLGRYNALSGSTNSETPNDDLLIVGNGQNNTTRSNALTVKKNGDVNVAGKLRVWPSGDLSMGSFKSGTKPNVGVDPEGP